MIPEEFAWLKDIKGNCILEKALDYYGVVEFPGDISNPMILSWAKQTKKEWYNEDKLDWCGIFISYIVDACGYSIPQRSNRSLSWIDWGVDVTDNPEPGDIIIFKKEGISGHIGLYVKEEENHYWVLGGNQNLQGKDSVNIKKIKKRKFVRICKPEIKQDETSQNQITPESQEGGTDTGA